MPAPSHTQDTIAHLRHCVQIESATGSYQVLRAPMLTETGGIVEVVSQGSISDDYEGTKFWIYPATSDDAPAGAHCIATTLCKRGGSNAVYHNLHWNGSSIDFDVDTDPFETESDWWYIIPSGDYFTIQSVVDGLFWTVVDGSITLSAYPGYDDDTQRWRMMSQYSPSGGVFNVSTSLDVSQSVMSLTSSDMGAASIGASSQRTAHTVLSAEFIELLSQSNNRYQGYKQMDLAFPVDRSETRWNRLEFLDDDTKRGQFEQRGPLRLDTFSTRVCSLRPSENMVAILPSLVGRFTGQRLRYNTSTSSDFSLSSYDGENRLGAFPTWQTSSMDPTDGTQAWMMLPQNFFDSALPTPMDLGCELIASGRAYELADTQTLPVPDDTTDMALRPRFDCDASEYLVTAKLRFLTDGVWSDVVTVLQPWNANYSVCSHAPYAKITGGPAWIPNAWPSSDSSRSITQDINTGALFYDHQDASACQVILSVSAMRYGSAEGVPPVPYEGRTVSRTFTIGRHVSVSLGDSTLDQDGIHLDISVSGATSYDVSIAKILFVNGANDPESILQPEGVIGSDIAFSDLTSITHALMIGDPSSAQLVVTGFVDSHFGTLPFSGATTLSSSLTQARVGATWSAWGGMAYDQFSSLGNFSAYAGFQIVESEQGRRYAPIKKIYVPRSGIPYAARCGTYLGDDETTDPECAVVIWDVDFGSRYQYEIITSQSRPNLAAALYRRVHGISGTSVHEHIEIIPLRGNLSGSMSVKNDLAVARRIGGRRYVAGSLRGQEPSLKFTGTIYADALDTVTPAPRSNDPLVIKTDIQTLMSIDASETLLLRTTWGTEHLVRIAGVDAPRDIASAANLTIDLIEVES